MAKLIGGSGPNSLLARYLVLTHGEAVMADSIQALTAEIRAFRDARDWLHGLFDQER